MQRGATSIREFKRRRYWLRTVQVLVIGYEAMSRTFAYLGIFPVFISEIVLGWFLLRRSSAINWFFSRSKRSKYVEMLRTALIIFVAYGFISLLIGYLRQPKEWVAAFQNLAYNYYALYLIIGVWLAAHTRLNMRNFAALLGWGHGIYGILWVVLLNRISTEIPGTPGVDMFGQPTGAGVAILTLIAFEPRIKKMIVPLLLNLFVMLAVQVRSEWLGFIIAFTLWSYMARKMSRLFMIVGTLALFMAIALVFDLKMPGVMNRGGEVSVQGIYGRIIAPFDANAASKYLDDAVGYGGTVDWRKNWWAAIWDTVNKGDIALMATGEGYGFPITEVVDYVEAGIRTPHCIFFYALAYGGWCGVAVLAFFQFTLLWCLYRCYRLTGQPYGVAFWTLTLTMALLGNQLETPFGAIPFYLLVGMSLKPLFVPREMWEESRRGRPLPRYALNSPAPVREVRGTRSSLSSKRPTFAQRLDR